MNLFAEAIAWIFDPEHFAVSGGVVSRVVEHIWISLLVLAIAAVIAIPLGYLIGHTGRGRTIIVALSGGVRALPTLGLLIILALNLGISLQAPVIALVILAIPSILAGAYAGFEAIDRRTIDAARAVGMTEWQILSKVEMPLGLPLLMGGLRSAALQVIATATLVAYVGGAGLGGFIFRGQRTGDYPQMLAGSILVVILAILFEVIFSILQKAVIPAGVAARSATSLRTKPIRSRSV
ncbi:MAG: transporter permease [Glaciihabitans sp.]|nr:transporter permease [Glaciihabitans sp.]